MMLPRLKDLLLALVNRLSRGNKRLIFLLVDCMLAPSTLWFCILIAFNRLPLSGEMASLWPLFPLVACLSLVASALLRMPSVKLNAYEFRGICRTGLMSILVTAGLALSIGQFGWAFPLSGIFLFALMFFLVSVIARMAMLHVLLWVLRAGQPRSRVLIYGAGKTGMQLVAALRAHDSILPVAFVDDNPALHSLSVAGLRIFSPHKIDQIAKTLGADRVLLAMPSKSAPKAAGLARRLQGMGLSVMALPSFAQLVGVEKLIDTLVPVDPSHFLGRPQMDQALPQGAEAYQGRSILVSGAGGSVGSELCRQLLLCRPKTIVLFEMSEIALYSVDSDLGVLARDLTVRIVPILGSVTDSHAVQKAMVENDVDVVFHAAAYKHVPMVEANPVIGISNNVLGTKTLADAALASGVKSFVLISTDKAVRPTSVMGATKRLAELVVQDMANRTGSTAFSIVRFGNVLGSSGSVIPLFRDQIARGGPITLTHPDVTRYFMTLNEAARLVLLAGSYADGKTATGGSVFVLDMGQPVKIMDLARQMIAAAGCTVRDDCHPGGDIEIAVTGLRPGEKLHEELLIGTGLLTTPHPKILRAKEHGLSEFEMASALRALRNAVADGDIAAARQTVHAYVEGHRRDGALLAGQ